MNRHEEEWAKALEGKDEAEILSAPLPANLTEDQCVRFRSVQRDAAEGARQAKAQAKE